MAVSFASRMNGARFGVLCLTLIATSAAAALSDAATPDTGRIAAARPQPRIVNGVDSFDYPSVGALLWTDDGGISLRPACTATLIGCQTVLTAAHCVCVRNPGQPDMATLPGPLCMRQGAAEAFRPKLVFALPDAGEFRIAAVSFYPQFVPLLGGDVAVLHLDRPATGVVPSGINSIASPALGTPGVIVGFGATSASEGGTRSQGSGIKRVGRISTGDCGPSGATPDKHVCWLFDEDVGPPGLDSDTCYGDSGGPLFVDAGDRSAIAGVSSGGRSDDCLPGDTAYDADVYAYREWIESVARADLGSARCGAGPQVGEPGTQRHTWAGTLEPGHDADAYSVDVPAGTARMRIALNNQWSSSLPCPVDQKCLNDFSLYAGFDQPPTASDFECADTVPGPFHFCEIEAPQAGTWYVQAERSTGAGSYQVTVTLFATAPTPCVGDCGLSKEVTVDELMMMVNVALGDAPAAVCAAGDPDGNDHITVDELVAAVNRAVIGCEGGSPGA